MSGDEHNIPSINVTDAANSTPSLRLDPTTVPPNSALLSPASHPPPSPVHSDYSSTTTYPPSPTISVGSNFKTTLALRENQPDDKSGFSSLNMLSPKDAEPSGHKRKPSNATMNSSVTEADVEMGDIAKVRSYATSLTDVEPYSPPPSKSSPEPSSSNDEKGKKNKKKKDSKDKDKDTTSDEHEGKTTHQLELLQDEGLDPAPFMFKPYQLAHMLDPKSLDTLTSFGGTTGLLRGLGTSAEYGLSAKSLPRSGTVKSTSANSNKDLPTITLTEPSGIVREPSNQDDHPAYHTTLDDRKRIYGENLLPQRPSKSLLQLMWLALKDKVLVRFIPFLHLCVCSEGSVTIGSSFNRCGYFPCLGSFPGSWHPARTRTTAGRMG